MKYRVTLKTAIAITKYATTPISCWPLSPDASTANILRYKFIWWFTVINSLGSTSATIYTIYKNIHDPDLVVKLLTEAVAMSLTVVKLVICKKEVDCLQSLLDELQMFLSQAIDEEMELIQSYVDRCILSHTVFFVLAIIGPVAYILGPVVTSQPLPGDTTYPFSLETYWIWATVYISQSLIVVQVGCMAILDLLFAILLWYTGARFEMLSMELERATNTDDVIRCIQKHQKLIRYVEKLKAPIGIMAFVVTALTMCAVTTGGFVLIRHPPLYIAAKFVFFELVAAWELFLYTWPANNLSDMSQKIGDAAFGCAWIGKSPTIMKDVLFIMQRSRYPLVIEVDGLLPALSLQLYGTAMSTSFSYLTTLRAITDN